MDKQKFYKAVDMIDDDLIKEAEIAPDKLMESDGEGMTVSGVETYRRPKWSIIASVAAAAVLVLGVGASLNMLMKHRPNVVHNLTDDTLENSIGSDPAEEVTKESEHKQGAGGEATAAQHIEGPKPVDTSENTSTAPDNGEEPTAVPIVENNGRQQETVQTAAQQTTKPAENTASKTTARTTSKTTAKTTTKRTEPVTTTTKSVTTEKMDVFARLNELTYSPDFCDGLPEYVLNAPGDTEIFYFNFREKWVWRNGSASNPVLKEAVLPDDLAEYLMAHGEEIGMYPSQYSVPIPIQSYDFNAQYIRTNCYGGNVSYPQKKLITSRSELDSYIEEYWENAKKRWSGSYDDDEFIKAAAKYDDNWFSTHKLMLVVLETGSGSHRYNVVQVGGIGVTIERKLPQIETCDMAEWHILIEVDKDVYVNSDFMVSTYDTYVQDNWLT
ncbi:MAG: hypothetical protein J6X56_11070 [Ruminococcus sp.]|nr:hypothetical protein [Ruminococcus sp.]